MPEPLSPADETHQNCPSAPGDHRQRAPLKQVAELGIPPTIQAPYNNQLQEDAPEITVFHSQGCELGLTPQASGSVPCGRNPSKA